MTARGAIFLKAIDKRKYAGAVAFLAHVLVLRAARNAKPSSVMVCLIFL
jgi:hypothetical protein